MTLAEAVASGRRWRRSEWRVGYWMEPGMTKPTNLILIADALSSDFEIEPEPEKPREWRLCLHNSGAVYNHEHGPNYKDGLEQIRVVDADAVERIVCADCRAVLADGKVVE